MIGKYIPQIKEYIDFLNKNKNDLEILKINSEEELNNLEEILINYYKEINNVKDE